MFVWNNARTAIINIDQIVFVALSEPYLERRNYRVIATTAQGGAHMLYEGTREGCVEYMNDFSDKCQNAHGE